MFRYIAIQPLYHILLFFVFINILVYMTPTYQKYISDNSDDSNKRQKLSVQQKWDNKIDLILYIPVIIFLIYSMFNFHRLGEMNFILSSLYILVLFLTMLIMVYSFIFLMYKFILTVFIGASYNHGLPLEENSVFFIPVFFYTITTSIKPLQYDNFIQHCEKIIQSISSIFISDIVVIIIYVFTYCFLILFIFLNFFIALRNLSIYVSLKTANKKPIKTDKLKKNKSILKRIEDYKNSIWNKINSNQKVFEKTLVLGLYTITHMLYFILKTLTLGIMILCIPILAFAKTIYKIVLSVVLKIKGANFTYILAISSRISIIASIAISFITFKYIDIISSKGVEIYEFLFSIFIIPVIFASITNIQAKKKSNIKNNDINLG